MSAPRPSNSPVIFAIVAIALAGLVGLNVMSNQMRPKSDHELEAEQKEQNSPVAAASPAAAPGFAPVAGAPGAVSASDPNGLVLAGQGTVSGSATAKKEVIVGFAWTPEVQSDPSKVSNAVEALQKSLGDEVRVKVVNVDESPDVPEGVSFGGKVLVTAQSDGMISPAAAQAAMRALAAAP